MSKNGLLLVGHGSRLQYNKELITTTAQMMAERTDKYLIKSCFMENSVPTVPEGLDAMRNGSNRGVFTLANGREIPVVYAEPIGIDPLLAELMLKNAEKAVTTYL